MTDIHPDFTGKILTDRRGMTLPPVHELVRKAAAKAGVGPGRIFREIIGLVMRRGGITQREYFGNHLYRTDLTKAEKREFIGEDGSYRLNLRLAPPELTRMRGFLNDKITLTRLWQSMGLRTTNTRAVFTRDRWLGPIRTLRDAAGIEGYLRDETDFPIFGKPIQGQQSLGAVRIDSIDAATNTARLGNGREVGLGVLAEEIVHDFPDGYMFQDLVIQHPEITGIFGPALSCMRLVTVITEPGASPEVFYAYWKIAAYEGMSDNFWQPGSLLADVDAEHGVIRRCVVGKGPDEELVRTHPVTGKQVEGYQVPFWQEAVDLVRQAHAIYPINGCLGWDVAFTAEGPVLIECNDNTGHNTYQIVSGKGMNAPEFTEVTERVVARNQAIAKDLSARVYKIEH